MTQPRCSADSSQWERLVKLHCRVWEGCRAWYSGTGSLLRSVDALRILEEHDDNQVDQINRYFGQAEHFEKWQLLRSKDNNTFFPPIPEMRSYFSRKGDALWGAEYLPGRAFKFELFFYRNDARMSVMPKYDEAGVLVEVMHVREMVQGSPSIWSSAQGGAISGKVLALGGLVLVGDVSGREYLAEYTPLNGGASRISLMLPDGLLLDVPQVLDGRPFEGRASWRGPGSYTYKQVAQFAGLGVPPRLLSTRFD
jgi:hypothetical protein